VGSSFEVEKYRNPLSTNPRLRLGHVVDETVYQYTPRKKTRENAETTEPIPLVYIPRKPHPYGLLNWVLACKSSLTGIPYVLSFFPHLDHPQVTSQAALRYFVNSWSYAHKPTFIADAVIGGFDLLNELEEKDITATFSCSSNLKPWIWSVLKKDLLSESWRAAIQITQYLEQ